MLRISLLITGFLCCIHTATAQNLVLNGDFEERYFPPRGHTLMLQDFVQDWYSYFTTPDYAYFPPEVPWHIRPRSGNAMVAGYQLGYYKAAGIYEREYIQGDLSAPLEAGALYYAEGYVCPRIQRPVINWCIRDIGFAFTPRHYTQIDSLPGWIIPVVPQVRNTGGVITDTLGWTKISGCFRAKGGERKIILGNFGDDSSTTGQLMLPPGTPELYGAYAYYYFDDISLEKVESSFSGDTIICEGNNILISANVPDAQAYVWSTGATSPDLQVTAAGAYTVTVTTKQGCRIQSTISVKTNRCTDGCPDMLIPDSFTPNGDGRNDAFRVINPDAMRFVDMSIYNRWGEIVFYSTYGSQGWDGAAKGRACDIGLYMYLIRYADCRDGGIRQQKGELTLLR